jgi:hypothetical protein
VVRVRGPVEPLADALRGEPWVRASADLGHGQLRVEVTSVTETETRMAGVIASAGVRLVSFEPEAADLESVFLELMS